MCSVTQSFRSRISLAAWAWGSRAGFYAGIGILTSVGIYLFTRILIPEVLLARPSEVWKGQGKEKTPGKHPHQVETPEGDQRNGVVVRRVALAEAFFSFSTRQEYYTYPAFPALILNSNQIDSN